MNKKIMVIGLVSFILLSISIAVIPIRVKAGNTIYVDDSGGADYTKIQDAIDNASDGDTISVLSGTYFENVVVDKKINLTGVAKSDTFIDGNGNGHVVQISNDDVTISGFTVQNTTFYCAGIIVDNSQNVRILDNIAKDNTFGIAIESSDNCLIQSNLVIDNSQMGILLEYSSSNTIVENTIEGGSWSGIHILNSNDNILYHNNIFNGDKYSAYDKGDNTWDNGYPSGGNYWADYTSKYPEAVDADGDGIWDTPYDINGSNNNDSYPFMNSDGWTIYSSLEISTPDEIEENESFQVAIMSNDIPIENVAVDFSGDTYFTNPSGMAIITAPQVEHDTDLLISAYKDGYESAWAWVTILDSASSEVIQLVISAPPSVTEKETFDVTITANDNPVQGVTVMFDYNTISTNDDGIVSFTAPEVEKDTDYTIAASKEDYTPATETITIDDRHLVISVDFTVIEGDIFIVTIKQEDNEYVVVGADVIFNGKTQQTDTTGQVIFTAPNVNQNTNYNITATKEGYQSHVVAITVLNKKEIIQNGWIFGTVYDTSGSPLQVAKVCVILSEEENKCMLTDEDGTYCILVPAGNYSVMASKEGYTLNIKQTTVSTNEAKELSFTLQEGESQPAADVNEQLLEEKITAEINNNKVGAKIYVDVEEETISYYSDELTIELLESTEETFSFTVGASNDTSGTIIVLRIGEGTLSDLDNINVTFDGGAIDEFTDIEEFFDLQDNTNLGWLRVLTTTGLYILVRIPHFSEHEITISSLAEVVEEVVETLGGITTVVLYIAIFAILGILYIVPFFLVRKSK